MNYYGYKSPPKSVGETIDRIAGLRNFPGDGSFAGTGVDFRDLLVRRKVYHYAKYPANTKKVAENAILAAEAGAKLFDLLPDAVPLWTLRQLLRRKVHELEVDSLIQGLLGGKWKNQGNREEDCEKADRESDQFVRLWDAAKIERDLKVLKTVADVDPYGPMAITRRTQLCSTLVRLKIATACGKNVSFTCKTRVHDLCMRTVADCDYTPEVVGANSLLALLAPSTNVAANLLKQIDGAAVQDGPPPAEPEPDSYDTKVGAGYGDYGAKPLIFLPPESITPMPKVVKRRPRNPEPEPEPLLPPSRLITLD